MCRIVVKFGTKFGTKYLLHNLVPNLVMLPTCNHCCKLIRQVMVSSGFVQVMVSLWWIYCPFCKFGTKFATKFGTYLLPLCRFGTKIWYKRKREVHNVNAQAYEDCGQIWYQSCGQRCYKIWYHICLCPFAAHLQPLLIIELCIMNYHTKHHTMSTTSILTITLQNLALQNVQSITKYYNYNISI